MADRWYRDPINEGRHNLEWLVSPLPASVYREEVTIATGQGALESGTPMRITTAADPVAGARAAAEVANPGEQIDGWLMYAADATTFDQGGVLLTGEVELNLHLIPWPATYTTAAQRTTAIQALPANMKVRS